MENTEPVLKGGEIASRPKRAKSIHKKWVDLRTGAKALFTDLGIVLQLSVLAFLYAFFAFKFKIFYYVSLALTLLTGVYVFICERDVQSKTSWLFLLLVSFGSGYIVYFLADKRVCYGYDKMRYDKIAARTEKYTKTRCLDGRSEAVKNDCEYVRNSGGYVPYANTAIKYYPDAAPLFEDMLADMESAREFIFLEYFIVAEGKLLEKLSEILARKAAEGVEVRFLYDDVGCQGVFKTSSKKVLKEAGVKLHSFQKLATLFGFGLNYRDHRKIVVIDGKYGYTGGCNIADDYVNYNIKNGGKWKDAGLKIQGEAVDGLSLTFLRQWELSTREEIVFDKYIGKYVPEENSSVVLPYAGGPELDEPLCRGVYFNAISGARNKLYIMTPYLIPDGAMMNQIKAKAKSGVDVHIVLPAVPDYPFIYAVTRSNAERLKKHGVKIHYVDNTFVHSKVVLTENCAMVGSANFDMRSFYIEFDNGIYTDDKQVMADAEADFLKTFEENPQTGPIKTGWFKKAIAAALRVVSPLM